MALVALESHERAPDRDDDTRSFVCAMRSPPSKPTSPRLPLPLPLSSSSRVGGAWDDSMPTR